MNIIIREKIQINYLSQTIFFIPANKVGTTVLFK